MLFQTVCKSALVAATAMLMAGCAAPPQPPAEAQVPPPAPAPRVLPVEVEPAAPASRLTPPPPGSPAPIAMMLAYADKVRPLNGNDLAAEIARLGDPADSPTTQMQLALALAQTRVSADLARAAGLMQRVMANPSPEAQALHPLARALTSRYFEQRRVEDDRDRQAQQVRDAQRRIDQLNDRMEALRAIERSFARPNTPPAAAPAAPAAAPPANNAKPPP
ncbi:hypothetical protein QTH89_18135 [Variovorax sp. J22G21]|uniref:hypothetical protein n=1 Tax=Variovorax fucosicus TaxID=3053517 RepID=UPI0025773FED|nr:MULTISPECIES: hypothetical protein [unclassified Variovorax]MDM0038355.1 hypothetical protein [Variovorax sp. J22R193]MDM0063131.1 hypothetical protein [Variovorax sp. J22G21]